jgi:hypothetical protein
VKTEKGQKLKNNKLRTGLKYNKKLNESLYFFITEKQIDWALIIACFLAPLPYLSSSCLIFFIAKIVIYIGIIILGALYLKKWNWFRKKDLSEIDIKKTVKDHFANKSIGDLDSEYSISTKVIKEVGEEIRQENLKFKNVEDRDKEITERLSEKLKKENLDVNDFNKTILSSLIVFSKLAEIRDVPKSKLRNYYKLTIMITLTVVLFVIYIIETCNFN